MKFVLLAGILLAVASITFLSPAADSTPQGTEGGIPILWRDPGDISSLDLYHGPGGPEGVPQEPFVFVEEDLDGSSPKFDVIDRNGVEWKVKLGIEAGPETAAVRLLWAVGYFVQPNYLLPALKVQNLPERLERGQELVGPNGTVYGARLKRAPENSERMGRWRWKENPFVGTREFNGLRVMMAFLNNLDVKDDNTRIFRVRDPGNPGEVMDLYIVSDVGGSFSEHIWPFGYKGNLVSYTRGEFIKKLHPGTVDLNFPTGPRLTDVVHLPWYFYRLSLRWIGKDIPRDDARWMGEQLGRLSRTQIEDAFRAAGFSSDDVRGFADEVLERTAALKGL